MKRAYLGIDIGTTAIKVVLIDEDGNAVAEGDHPGTVSVPQPGWSEQQPEDWWSGVIAATRAALNKAPGDVEVVAASLSGQMHSSVMLDEKDEVIRPAILWNDVRTSEQCRFIRETIGHQALRRYASNPAVEGFTVTKVLWLREHEPDNYRRLRTLMLAKDYIRFRMTGEKATEPSDAGGTLLFNVRAARWSKEIAAALELDPRMLPPVIASTESGGTLTRRSAADLGLPAGIPVAGGAADNAAAAAGAGVVAPGTLMFSVGTSGTVVAPTLKPRVDHGMRIHLMNHVTPGVWYFMGVVLSAGAAFNWYRRALGAPDGTPPAYDDLTREAAGTGPGAEKLTFLPYLTGERTPHADASARGVFCGLYAGHTRAHMSRAVLEGVAFALKDSLELEKRLGVSPSQAVIAGGGALSPAWRQIMADIFEVPLVTVGTARGGNAGLGAPLGAAMIAAVCAGQFRSVAEAADSWLTVTGSNDPDARTFDPYRDAYRRYRSLYRRLKPQFAEA